MKVLFVSSRLPCPTLKGDQVVLFNRLKTLSQYHDVVFLGLYQNDSEVGENLCIKEYVYKSYFIKKNALKSFFDTLKEMILGNCPLQVAYYNSKKLRVKMFNLINEEKIEIVHVFLLRMMNFIKTEKKLEIPIVLEAIDSMQLNFERRIKFETGIKKMILKNELHRLEKYEKNIGKYVDEVILVSNKDKDRFLTKNITILPNGVDQNEFYFKHRKIRNGRMVFSGNMNYFPNIQAVEWFLEHVFPILNEYNDKIIFYIAGSNAEKSVQKYHNGNNIIVTGYVESMGDFLRFCDIAVAPMQSGSGMQNKIIEAMSTGLPVVTTTLGQGDIRAENEKEIVVKDNPLEFAEAIIKLLNNDEYYKNISKRATRFIKRNHSWERTASIVNDIYVKSINKYQKHIMK